MSDNRETIRFWMDPADGGEAPLDKQVMRMVAELDRLTREELARRALEQQGKEGQG